MRTPLRTAHGPWTEREGLVLRLENEDGRAGYGEVAPISWFGTETLAEVADICRKLGDQVTDAVLDAVPERCGCVRFALACAREAIVGRARQTPRDSAQEAGLLRHLRRASVGDPALQQGRRLPVTALLPPGRAVLETLPARLETGFISFKWKVGVGDAADELVLLDDVFARLPAYAKLRLDANGAWDRRTATKWLARCAERPVEFVEQPLAPRDEDGLLGLAGDFPVTLALDESVVRLAEARRWQSLGWPGVFVIKPTLAGPLDELGAWVAETKADVVLSSAIETVLARSAVLRFVLMHPALTKRALGFGVGEVFGDRRWDGPMLGPVLDTGWLAGFNEEESWNALA